jgi:hypothetical protein
MAWVATAMPRHAMGCLGNANKLGITFFQRHTTQPSSIRAMKQILNIKKLKKDVVYLRATLFLGRVGTKDFKFLTRL